jgi:hypothetical protein
VVRIHAGEPKHLFSKRYARIRPRVPYSLVDVRNTDWPRRIVNELVPAIRRAGFDGIFADTLDNPKHLERTDTVRYADREPRRSALSHRSGRRTRIWSSREPRLRYTAGNRRINRHSGLGIGLCYLRCGNTPILLVPEESYFFQRELLRNVKRRTPGVSVFTLGYRDPADAAGAAPT